MRNIQTVLQIPRWVGKRSLSRIALLLSQEVGHYQTQLMKSTAVFNPHVKKLNWSSNSQQCCNSDIGDSKFPSHVMRTKRNGVFVKQYAVLWCDICSSVRHYSQCVQTYGEYKRTTKQNQQSALYVGHSDQFNVATVYADLNLEQRFKNLQALHQNIVARGMDLNVYELYSKYKELHEIRHTVQQIESRKQSITDAIAQLRPEKDNSVESSENFEKLRHHVREIKAELKPVIELYNELEEEVTLEALKLPSDLHQYTPAETQVLEEVGEKPDFSFTPRDHVKLGDKTQSVIFSTISPGAYYLQGRLAHLQYRLECHLDSLLQQAGLTPFVCPDKVKSMVLEGSGYDITDPQMVFKVQKKQQEIEEEESHGLLKLDNTYHLIGVSPMAFNVYLTRVNVSEASLPLKYYSIGNTYSPRPLYTCQQYPSLLASPQATVVELFGGGRNGEDVQLVYEEYVSIMKEFYKTVNLPIRYVQVGAASLNKMEAARLDTEIWMPSVNVYVKVGCVSLWNDYASRRLMMKYSSKVAETMNKNYIHTVHSTLVNMPVFIAALMENTQTKVGQFEIAKELSERLGL